ncbi:MAG TPA: DUF1344 domain-containing protein [Devosia sp.]|jgi:Cu/Ag efflux protein CusF|nr:DUF1344 domain-containing protein [Devosia sp.]
MRKLLLPILIIASLGATQVMAATTTTTPAPATTTAMTPAKPAPAPTTTDGAISKIDAKTCIVTLDKKKNYHFDAKCDFSKLKVGDKVAITWAMKGKYRWASAIVEATA